MKLFDIIIIIIENLKIASKILKVIHNSGANLYGIGFIIIFSGISFRDNGTAPELLGRLW